MNDLGTGIWSHNTSGVEVACDLCGERWEQDHAAVCLLWRDEPAGDLCPGCVHAGPGGAAERMRRRATRLQERAEALRGHADEVAAIPASNWVGLEALVRTSLEAKARAMGTEPENLIEEHLEGCVEAHVALEAHRLARTAEQAETARANASELAAMSAADWNELEARVDRHRQAMGAAERAAVGATALPAGVHGTPFTEDDIPF